MNHSCSCSHGDHADGSTGEVLVQLRNLSAGYSSVPGVTGVDLTLRRGTVTALTGPNGAGKTTLLRALAGLGTILSGEIVWADGIPPRAGLVAQASNLDHYCPLTVLEFLKLSFLEKGRWSRPAKPEESLIGQALRETDSEHLKHRRLGALSGGETQRVLIAYALLRDADLLLLDEPQTGLDPESSDRLAILIRRLVESPPAPNRPNRALVLVSHDLHFVARVADQVACLRGHLCGVGTPAQMLAPHPDVHEAQRVPIALRG